MKLPLTNEEEKLIKKVCELQLSSFERILNGEQDFQLQAKLIEHRVSEMELINLINEVSNQYKIILENPSDLFLHQRDLLNNFTGALEFNAELLTEHEELIPALLNKLSLASFIFQHQN